MTLSPASNGISGRGRAELTAITARGKRLISVTDVVENLDIDRRTAAKKLARWAEQGWLRRVRRGLYIPVPIDAEQPASWSEDPLVLADAVWAPCYFTGWTSANHWGLTEQVFHTTVLKTAARVRSARERLMDSEYRLGHILEREIEWGTKPVWRDHSRVRMADPARTVIDVLDDPSLAGGIRHGTEILASYLDEEHWETLVSYGDRLGNRAVFKRLGYLLEATDLGHPELRDACERRVSTGISLLDPTAPPAGPRLTRWGLRLNVRVEAQDPS